MNRAARILDAGAQGVIFPHVEDAAEARTYVDACRFPAQRVALADLRRPPTRVRDHPAARSHGALDEESLIVMMIETPGAVENAAERSPPSKASMPCWWAVADLSATMGIPGEFTRPEYKAAIRSVIEAAEAAGKRAGIGGIYNEELMAEFVEAGARFLLGGADLAFILAGAKARGKFLNELDARL